MDEIGPIVNRAGFRTVYAEDLAAENVRYFEVRYSPILHQQRGLSLPAIVDAVVAGLRAPPRHLKFDRILRGNRKQ